MSKTQVQDTDYPYHKKQIDFRKCHFIYRRRSCGKRALRQSQRIDQSLRNVWQLFIVFYFVHYGALTHGHHRGNHADQNDVEKEERYKLVESNVLQQVYQIG